MDMMITINMMIISNDSSLHKVHTKHRHDVYQNDGNGAMSNLMSSQFTICTGKRIESMLFEPVYDGVGLCCDWYGDAVVCA